MEKFEYRTVDITTEKGLREAERLHTSGKWRMIRQGLFSIQFERRIISTEVRK